MDKINKNNLAEHLIKKQLEMIGKTVEDIKTDNFWYSFNTITEEQHKEWKKYSITLIKKIYKLNNKMAETAFNWFDLEYGLRIKNTENE